MQVQAAPFLIEKKEMFQEGEQTHATNSNIWLSVQSPEAQPLSSQATWRPISGNSFFFLLYNYVLFIDGKIPIFAELEKKGKEREITALLPS